jgi:hypothetical protein
MKSGEIMRALTSGLIALALCLGQRVTQAQSTAIRLQAYNGKTGKPLPYQRLLVFAGTTQENVRFHQKSFDLTTGDDGEVKLLLDSSELQWLQVWADYRTLCQSAPNNRSFKVSQILSTGLSTPNNCGSFARPFEPGKFTLFARPATRAEKRRW